MRSKNRSLINSCAKYPPALNFIIDFASSLGSFFIHREMLLLPRSLVAPLCNYLLKWFFSCSSHSSFHCSTFYFSFWTDEELFSGKEISIYELITFFIIWRMKWISCLHMQMRQEWNMRRGFPTQPPNHHPNQFSSSPSIHSLSPIEGWRK